jgi:hypothetical protein
MRKPKACASLKIEELLFGRCGLAGGVGSAGEDGVVATGAREQDGEADGGQHEDDGRVGGELGEEIGCAARAEGGLGSLATEGAGEVGGLALLQEDYANEKETDDNVNDDEKNNHRSCLLPLGPGELISGECLDWRGEQGIDPISPCGVRA